MLPWTVELYPAIGTAPRVVLIVDAKGEDVFRFEIKNPAHEADIAYMVRATNCFDDLVRALYHAIGIGPLDRAYLQSILWKATDGTRRLDVADFPQSHIS